MGKLMIASLTGLALALGTACPSLAQTSGHGAMGMANGHHMARASKLMGEPIYNAQGQQIGTLTDVLIDPSGGATMVVVSPSNDGGMIALPIKDMRVMDGKMETQLSLERMHKFNWNTFYGSAG